MGCDIHGRVQYKFWKGQEAWSDMMEIPDSRNYALFARLAGVRKYDDDVPAISEPRGFPADFEINGDEHLVYHGVDGDCVERYWMGDHSYSWLSLKEMLEWDGWEHPSGFCDSWVKFLRWLESLNYEDCRIIFGFDN